MIVAKNQVEQYASLLSDLEGHNKYFDEVVNLFPATLYITGNTGDEAFNPKYMKGQNKESKEARRARIKEAQLSKSDPEKVETTLEAKRRLAQDEKVVKPGDTQMPTNIEEVNSMDIEKPGLSRIEILRAKLHQKIAEKAALCPKPANGTISKRAKRRAEKLKRIEDAKRRKHGHSPAVDKSPKIVVIEEVKEPVSKAKDLSGIDFGNIAGLAKTPHYLDNKSLNATGKKKKLEKLLEDAENKIKRMKELKEGSESEQKKASKMEWGDAFKQANGVRVRDAPDKIKKAIKQKAKKKAKSAAAWKSRTKDMKEKQNERQQIRRHNLDKRKKGGVLAANLSKKKIVDLEGARESEKKKRTGPHAAKGRAGFEGRKADFLNK